MSDLILDVDIRTDDAAYTLLVNQGDAVQTAAHDWYLEANGREPSRSDIWHGTWRGLKENARWGTLRAAFQNTWPKPVEPGPITATGRVITTNGTIWFSNGEPWRWKGVTAFGLVNKFRNGENIDGFLGDYAGFNLLRGFDHTVAKDGWNDRAWAPIPPSVWIDYINYTGDRGWKNEVVLLTSDDDTYLHVARNLIAELKAAWVDGRLRYMPFIEAGNEPLTHKTTDVEALHADLAASGFPYSSGIYEDSSKFFGSYYNYHSRRDESSVRDGKALREAWDGSGPDKPHGWQRLPCGDDEPGKQQDLGSVVKDWRAAFGCRAIMGAGATRHTETGKFGDRPTADELSMNAVVLSALNAFPLTAPGGSYRRIVEPGNEPGGPTEHTSRTYIIGNCAVRCKQDGTSFPELGWTALDDMGVLWMRA